MMRHVLLPEHVMCMILLFTCIELQCNRNELNILLKNISGASPLCIMGQSADNSKMELWRHILAQSTPLCELLVLVQQPNPIFNLSRREHMSRASRHIIDFK
jgi:hypothetical protein